MGNEPNSAEEISAVKECLSLNESVSKGLDDLENKSNILKRRIKTQLDKCSSDYQKEWDNIHQQEIQIHDLKREIDNIKQKNTKLLFDKELSDEKIKQYELETKQGIEQYDEIEDERKRCVPKLKQHISLLAAATRIKWDFNQEHLLEGEVDIRSKR